MSSDLYVAAYVVAYITFAIGILSLIARFYSRALVIKSWDWDDWASVVVFLINIVHQVVLQLFMNLGCDNLMTVLQCIPFEKILNPTLYPEVKCIDTLTVMLTPPILMRLTKSSWTIR
uniref:Uncharacterized protein n=1 Tax=Gibberella zeae TaxID=5518 RepID=A0A4E9EGD4_GIBZA